MYGRDVRRLVPRAREASRWCRSGCGYRDIRFDQSAKAGSAGGLTRRVKHVLLMIEGGSTAYHKRLVNVEGKKGFHPGIESNLHAKWSQLVRGCALPSGVPAGPPLPAFDNDDNRPERKVERSTIGTLNRTA